MDEVRRVLSIVAVAVALVLGVGAMVATVGALAGDDVVRNDFTTDYVSARAWMAGGDPYAPIEETVEDVLGFRIGGFTEAPGGRNPHPPIYIVIVALTSGLSHASARIAWVVATSLLVSIATWRYGSFNGWHPYTKGAAAIGVLAIPVVHKDLLYGSGNALLLLMIVVAWVSLRQGRQRTAGIALGFAAAIKLFPGFLVISLLADRKRLAAKWQITSALGFSLLGMLCVGTGAAWRWVRSAVPGNVEFWGAAPQNISPSGVAYRWFSPNAWYEPIVSARWLTTLVLVAVAGACALAAWRSRSGLLDDPFLSGTMWMLLAMPFVWDFYLPLLVPVGFLLLRRWHLGRVNVLWLLPLAVILVGAPPGLPPPLPGVSVATQALGYALPGYSLAVLAIADLRRPKV